MAIQGLGVAIGNEVVRKHELLRSGVIVCRQRLISYSETKGLLNQAKGALARVNHETVGASKQARAVLTALGVEPWTDMKFSVHESVL